jgi:hypothetical protein
MKTAAELAMEKADAIAAAPAPFVDARPQPPDDDPTIEWRGNARWAVVRRGKKVAEERVPLHIDKWPRARMRSYLIAVAQRLRAELDGPPKPEEPDFFGKLMVRRDKKIRLASARLAAAGWSHLSTKEQRLMSAVLNARLQELKTITEAACKPENAHQDAVAYGRALGLAAALAQMTGRGFEPPPPPPWQAKAPQVPADYAEVAQPDPLPTAEAVAAADAEALVHGDAVVSHPRQPGKATARAKKTGGKRT